MTVFDVGNTQTGNDIRVNFDLGGIELTDFSFIVNPDGIEKSVSQALSLSAEQIHVASIELGELRSAKLSSITLDSEGNEIKENTLYTVQIITSDNSKISAPSESFSLTNVPPLNGNYKGVWNDNLYSSLPLSMTITGAQNSYGGSFYFTGNFSPQNQATNDDGRVGFKLEEESVNQFSLTQILFNVNGADGTFYEECPGQYDGQGTLISDIIIDISFEGTDCEGPHTGGSIVFRKTD